MRLVTFKDLWLIWRIPFRRQSIYRLQHPKKGPPKFPLRRKVGNLNFWTYDEIDEWVRTMWRPNGPATP